MYSRNSNNFDNNCLQVSCQADFIELGDIPDNGNLYREVDCCQDASLAQDSLIEVLFLIFLPAIYNRGFYV